MLKDIQNHIYAHSNDFDFENLCVLLSNNQYELATEQIKTLAATIHISSLPFDALNYTRNIIIQNKHHWLGLINWDKGAKTRVHGHPKHAFFYVIQGALMVQDFAGNPLSKCSQSQLLRDDYRYSDGVEGKMDNCVHQMNAQEKSLSLHFYSGDPTQGEVF